MSTEAVTLKQAPTSLELEIRSYFQEFESQTNEWLSRATAIQVTDANQKDLMKQARDARLALKQIRIQIEGKRKSLKEESLKTGQIIDKTAKALTGMIEPIEEILQGHEDFVKKQKEKEREELYKKRLKIAAPLIGAACEQMALADMDEDVFETMIDGYKLAKAEKDKRDKELADLKLKADADAKALQESNAKELEALRLSNQAQQDELKKFQEQEADKKKKEEEDKKATAKLRRAPDKKKLVKFCEDLEAVKCEDLREEEAKELLRSAMNKLHNVRVFILKEADDL